MTHGDLVGCAAKWLEKQQRCSVIVTEIATAAFECPDALGWQGARSLLVECKASRSDFMADRQKPFRANPEFGIGRQRYFLTLPGVVAIEELPEKWGLLELTGTKIRTIKGAEAFSHYNTHNELFILLSAIRRIGHTPPKGVSIKCYSIESLNRATLGIQTCVHGLWKDNPTPERSETE